MSENLIMFTYALGDFVQAPPTELLRGSGNGEKDSDPKPRMKWTKISPIACCSSSSRRSKPSQGKSMALNLASSVKSDLQPWVTSLLLCGRTAKSLCKFYRYFQGRKKFEFVGRDSNPSHLSLISLFKADWCHKVKVNKMNCTAKPCYRNPLGITCSITLSPW